MLLVSYVIGRSVYNTPPCVKLGQPCLDHIVDSEILSFLMHTIVLHMEFKFETRGYQCIQILICIIQGITGKLMKLRKSRF